MFHGTRPHDKVLAETAGNNQVFSKDPAERLAIMQAEVTVAARNVVRSDHPVADGERLYTLSQFGDRAHQLMTQDPADGWCVLGDLEQIGAAEPTAAKAQKDLA
jgi:hypothetical protein